MNSTQGDPIVGFFILIVLYVLPIFVSALICKEKNRNPLKGVFITLFFGWLATVGLWLALRKRDKITKQLI